MNKYKLCRVCCDEINEAQPINEKGEAYGDILETYQSDQHYFYAIYENQGDDECEDWYEYKFYADFDKAVKEYKKLKEGQK